MQLFFSQNITESTALLEKDDARHCNVLRKNVNDIIQIIDGKGYLYQCQIVVIKKDFIETKVISSVKYEKSRAYYFHLYIAPTKQNERIEWLLEKAIETGLDEITFIQTEHSEKSRINIERLEKIAISAMKQSGEYYLPKINNLLPFKSILNNTVSNALNLLAHCSTSFEKKRLKEILYTNTFENINCFIGPEGDFSNSEIEEAYSKGFKGLSLGNTRLRTETAGLYCAMGLSNLA